MLFSTAACTTLALLAAGCRNEAPTRREASPALTVAVTIPPQATFVRRIGGDRVRVVTMVETGQCPETYEPKPAQLSRLKGIEIYFALGVPFEEAWNDRLGAEAPDLRFIDTSAGVPRIGEGAATDPHTWLSPEAVKTQAKTIAAALIESDPAGRPTYEGNLKTFLTDVQALKTRIRAILAPMKPREVLVYHPGWAYFAREYGIKMLAVEEEGREPGAGRLAEVVTQAKRDGLRVVFADREHSTREAEATAQEIGGRVVSLSLVDPDWFGNLERSAKAFVEGP